MVIMLNKLPYHWEFAAVLLFGSAALACKWLYLDYQQSYKVSEMTILNLAYQRVCYANMAFTLRTIIFKTVKIISHDCLISLGDIFYDIYYFTNRAVFFFNVEAVFFTSLVRVLLLLSPAVFFSIDLAYFSYILNIVIICGIIFDLCIRFHLYVLLDCQDSQLDSLFFKIDFGNVSNAFDISENFTEMANSTIMNKTNEEMVEKEDNCYIFPTVTILLFLILIFEFVKICVELYQLFMKYKYKIQQVKFFIDTESVMCDVIKIRLNTSLF